MLVPKTLHRKDAKNPGAAQARQTFVVKNGEVLRLVILLLASHCCISLWKVVEGHGNQRTQGNKQNVSPGEYQLDVDHMRRDKALAKREVAAMRGFLGR